MLLSMTGFGSARSQDGIAIEVRAVNNRHLKIMIRGGEQFLLLESEFEKVIRQFVRRGTLHVLVRCEHLATLTGAQLNLPLLQTYVEQILQGLPGLSGPDRTAVLAGALLLPGVAPETMPVNTADWPAIEAVLRSALEAFNASRQREGAAMARELRQLATAISAEIETIRRRLPSLMEDYRQRLLERVRLALDEAGAAIGPEHVIREVALYADRTDVAEELTRLGGHLQALMEVLEAPGESHGRRLEFIVQEMGREANTLGSKAADVAVSRHVIEIKTLLERIRELVQNVE